MPLVVPGLQSNDGNKTSQWMNELIGKKIGNTTNETTFARTDLPQEHRIISKEDLVTADYKPERLNVYVANDGTVTKVSHG